MPPSRTLKPKKNASEKTSETPESLSKTGKLSDPENKSSSRRRSDLRYERKRPNSPLTRIGVNVLDYVAAPKITPSLRQVPGGKKAVLAAMRFSDAELIRKFFEKYDSISRHDRDKLSIEAVALAAGVNIVHLLGEIEFALRLCSASRVKLIAVSAHPDVMVKTIEYAKLPGGNRDRQHVHEMLGALASNKGTTFINKVFTTGTHEGDSEPDPPEELADDLDYMFPDAATIQERVQPLRQKLLESGK